MANLKGQAHYAGLGSWSPLFFSPQEGGDHRNPSLDLRFLRLVGPLGSIFCPSQACFKNHFEKPSKKVRKSKIFGSQNPPKTFPKCLQKRCPKKHAILERFLSQTLQNFKRRNLEFINFTTRKSTFWRVSQKPCFCILDAFWLPKTTQKPLQNEVRPP